uniref:SKP1-like protein n=1 Tax=Physcomitrium patens TaxID=3218 RepID=A0A2K1JI85_PHYPA|nr:hypothetical protein PHYPA_018666 [Physcomitrium patens]
MISHVTSYRFMQEFSKECLIMGDKKVVKLKSFGGDIFEVDKAVALESQAIRNMIEDTSKDAPIPLPNVSSKILAKHVDNQKNGEDKQTSPKDEIKSWDANFVKVDQATLFDFILNLLDLTCQTVVDMIKDKTPEAIRKTFNIENDFT